MEDRSERPSLVSVVLATYNEAANIQKCLDSLRQQETPGFEIEILAVDGMSTDGTREYLETVAEEDSRVRIYKNEKRGAPFAFNIGIRASEGSFVCIFGSHTVYAKDYVSVCLRELLAKDAAVCSARVFTEPASGQLQARLVAYAFSHPFGSSGNSWRTQPEGYGEALGYMIFRKEVLLEVGGYSEELLRNQDNDVNEKIHGLGYKLYCTWKTHCFYQPKETIWQLFKYAHRNGFWNLISFKQNNSSMHVRHFVPFLFVLGLLGTLLIALLGPFIPIHGQQFLVLPFGGILLLHLGAGAIAALQTAFAKKDPGSLFLPFVFLGFHAAYGLGTLTALLTRAKPRGDFRKQENIPSVEV
jgi:succinoglycan biosynthesis protein ExoA